MKGKRNAQFKKSEQKLKEFDESPKARKMDEKFVKKMKEIRIWH